MTRELLERIARSVIGNAGMGRIVTKVGPFAAIIDPYSDRFWYSFAAPLVQSEDRDWEGGLAALRAHFTGAGRALRFEFLEVLFPELGPVLEGAGFTRA